MPQDLGKLEDDMGSIEALRNKRPGAPALAKAAAAGGIGGAAAAKKAMAAPRPRPNPADANIFTADKGIQPPSPDEGPTMPRRAAPMGSSMPPRVPAMKKGGCVKKMKSGGSTGSASKRADGIASKGKTKGRII